MRLGWLSTGRDPAARNLLNEIVRRSRVDGLPLEIAAVFCDRDKGEDEQSDLFLGLARGLGLQPITLSSTQDWSAAQAVGLSREEWRDRFHTKVTELLEPLALDVLVLAGYMLIVSPGMCERYAMLNLHPALPGGPTGTWQQVIWALLAARASETGAMIHLVTPQLDRGPVLTFDRFAITGGDYDELWRAFEEKAARRGIAEIAAKEAESEPLFAAIRRRGEAREIPLLYRTVAQFVLGTLRADRCSVSSEQGPLPLDLTAEVDGELGRRG